MTIKRRKSCKNKHKGGKKSIRRMSKIHRKGGSKVVLHPENFPAPLPKFNQKLDSDLALKQNPLNTALKYGGKKKKTRKRKIIKI